MCLRAVCIGCAAACSAVPALGCADLDLVLALDASGSVDRAEFLLQTDGLAAAFRDEAVHDAMASAGTVHVVVMIWGDARQAPQVTEWQLAETAADADALAALIEGIPRRAGGSTGLGSALDVAVDMIAAVDHCAPRAVVDVSGDGTETPTGPYYGGHPLAAARKRAALAGVIVNGLAIETDEPELGDYYVRELIGGPGAFMMKIASYDDFAPAIRAKLLREIPPPMLALAR